MPTFGSRTSPSKGDVNTAPVAAEGPPLAGCGDLRFPPNAGRIGLRNLGNTCFMNAGLQCLSHIEPLAAYFLSSQYAEDVNTANPLGCKGELAAAFAELQRTLWQAERGPHDPRSLHRKLSRFAPHLFEGYEQQDVQEFLSFCLDGLHEDLNRVTEKLPPPPESQEKSDERLAEERGDEFAAALAWMRHLQRDKSFLVDLLQGQLQSSLTCTRCGHRSRRFDPFLYLSVPVTKKMSKVTDAIEKYLEEEVLSGEERWFCEKCKQKVEARKKIDIWKLPPVLVLHLKRFEFDPKRGKRSPTGMAFRKIDATLKAPEVLDLADYCSSAQRHGASYDVVCVANHSGAYGSGHYTATCRVGSALNGTWHHFNDERVSVLKSGKDVVGREAYVIFLVRCAVGSAAEPPSRSCMVRRQTVTMPELWPHWVSTRTSAVEALMQQLEDPGQSSGSASAADAGAMGADVSRESAGTGSQASISSVQSHRRTSGRSSSTKSVSGCLQFMMRSRGGNQ